MYLSLYFCFGNCFSKIPKLMKTLQIFRSFNYVKDGCQQFAETKTTPKISAKRTCPGYLLLLFTENNNCVSMKDSTHGSDIFSWFSFKQLLCNTLFTHLFLKTTFISTTYLVAVL